MIILTTWIAVALVIFTGLVLKDMKETGSVFWRFAVYTSLGWPIWFTMMACVIIGEIIRRKKD